MRQNRAYWRRRKQDKRNRANELASEIAARMLPDSTEADIYAIAHSLCDDSGIIDRAIRIINRIEVNNGRNSTTDTEKSQS